MSEQITKTELLARIRAEWVLLEALVAQIGREQMESLLLDNGWSVKDTLAHIASWERAMIEWLGNAVRGERPTWPEGEFDPEKVDQINAEFHEQNRGLTAEQAVATLRSTHQAALEALEAAPEDVLVEPGKVEWLGDIPFWELVADNTYVHFKDHRESIEKKLGMR